MKNKETKAKNTVKPIKKTPQKIVRVLQKSF